MKFILLINGKVPRFVGILTFRSKIKQHLRVLKQELYLLFSILVFMIIWNFMLSWVEHESYCIISGPGIIIDHQRKYIRIETNTQTQTNTYRNINKISRYLQSMTLRQVSTSTYNYKLSFFSLAIVQWNSFPESVACLQSLDAFKAAVCMLQHLRP